MEIMKSILVAIVIILIAYLIKKTITYSINYFNVRPNLTIDIINVHPLSSNIGLSPRAIIKDRMIIDEVSVFEIKWRFEISINNNSITDAYYPELTFSSNDYFVAFVEDLNRNTPILANDKIVLKARNEFIEHKRNKERTKMDKTKWPDEIKRMNIFLRYRNRYGRTFYSHYSRHNGETEFYKKIPRHLKKFVDFKNSK